MSARDRIPHPSPKSPDFGQNNKVWTPYIPNLILALNGTITILAPLGVLAILYYSSENTRKDVQLLWPQGQFPAGSHHLGCYSALLSAVSTSALGPWDPVRSDIVTSDLDTEMPSAVVSLTFRLGSRRSLRSTLQTPKALRRRTAPASKAPSSHSTPSAASLARLIASGWVTGSAGRGRSWQDR